MPAAMTTSTGLFICVSSCICRGFRRCSILRLLYTASPPVARCREIPLPSSPAAMPPVPHSVANATSLPGRGESVQGNGFSGGGKVFGTAQRRPLGGAGERSETEGVGWASYPVCIPGSPRHTEFTYNAIFSCQTIVFFWKVLYTRLVQCKCCLPKYLHI